jgi:hypothetical protein
MGDLVYIRCYSGSMPAKASLSNTTRTKSERPSKILQVLADDYEEVEEANAGSICVLAGLKYTRTGDTLVLSSDKDKACLLGLEVPPPVFFCTVEVESAAEEKDLNFALDCLAKEDPSLVVSPIAPCLCFPPLPFCSLFLFASFALSILRIFPSFSLSLPFPPSLFFSFSLLLSFSPVPSFTLSLFHPFPHLRHFTLSPFPQPPSLLASIPLSLLSPTHCCHR